LAALLTRQVLPPSRAKDFPAAVRYLATALGSDSPAACPVDAARLEVDTGLRTLDAHFATLPAQGHTLSAATQRNIRSTLRKLFRLAPAQGLLTAPPAAPLPPPRLTTASRADFLRHHRATAPYQSTYHPPNGLRIVGLPQHAWPPDIQAGWQEY